MAHRMQPWAHPSNMTELLPETDDLIQSLHLKGSKPVAHPCWTSVQINCFKTDGKQLAISSLGVELNIIYSYLFEIQEAEVQ